MPIVEHNGKKYEVSFSGFLTKTPEVLDSNWVEYVCNELGSPIISPDHPDWKYIKIVHEYFLFKKGKITEVDAQIASGLTKEAIFEKFGKLGTGLCRMAGARECWHKGCYGEIWKY